MSNTPSNFSSFTQVGLVPLLDLFVIYLINPSLIRSLSLSLRCQVDGKVKMKNKKIGNHASIY